MPAAGEPVGALSWLASRIARLVDQSRRGSALMGRAAWRGLMGVYDSDDLAHAAAIAYYGLLSFLPFLLLLFFVLGQFSAVPDARHHVLSFVVQYFPAKLDFVAGQLEAFRASGLRLGLGGVLALVWASQGVFGAISTAVNHAWRVEQRRSFWKHRLLSFVMMLAAGLLLILALVIISMTKVTGPGLFDRMMSQYPVLAVFGGWGSRLWPVMLFTVVVALIFYYVPNAEVRFRDVWPGALLTAVLWRVALEGFSWYLSQRARFNVHGSIAAVVWFLIWVYTSSVLLLYGVEFTAAYARLRRGAPGVAGATPRV